MPTKRLPGRMCEPATFGRMRAVAILATSDEGISRTSHGRTDNSLRGRYGLRADDGHMEPVSRRGLPRLAGAAFGFAQLWTVFFAFPLMIAVQLMCARLGLVSGQGLAGVLRRRYPKWVLLGACTLLAIANIVNIGADLGGMAEAMQMMTGLPSLIWLPAFAGLIVVLLIWSSYRHIARVFKWLTLVLFAYVVAGFMAHPDWNQILKSTFLPRVEWNATYIATFVAILGTTIKYNFPCESIACVIQNLTHQRFCCQPFAGTQQLAQLCVFGKQLLRLL